MSATVSTENFGSLLKFLRRRTHLTQRDLAAAVGYTEAHICRLEKNERLPDLTTVAALFVPALNIKDDPVMLERLLKLAAQARDERSPAGIRISQITIQHQVERDLGALEDIPALLTHFVDRPALTQRVRAALASDRCVSLCDMAGMGKTTLAATIARSYQAGPVFWHTLTEGVNTSTEAFVRQLALFLLAHGQAQVKPLVEQRAEAAPIALDQQMMLLRSALVNQPALLCFEDVHLLLGDESSLSLLRYLGTTTSASLLLTSRQEIPLPFTQINLGGLEPDEARKLIEHMGIDLKADLLERLFAKTERNPMLLRLAVGQLVEHRTDTEAFLEHLETQPQVSSYLLNTLLNDLPPVSQWLAGFLSAFRQPVDLYDETMVELIGKVNQADSYEDMLNVLQRRYLIENARHADLHPLVRDYLYAALSTDVPRKKQVHRLAAQWAERGGEIVEAAYHWTRAGDLEQATEVVSDQSEQLFNRGQANAAVQVVDEALQRAGRKRGDTTSLRRRLLKARGDLLRGTFRAAEAENSFREALSLAQNLPAVRAEIVRNLAQILLQRGRTAEALQLCQSAMKGLTPGDIILRARLSSIECRAHLALSHYDEAERLASEAITLAGQFAEALPRVADDVWARSERTLGWINYTRHPESTESLVHYRRALECARRAGLRVIESAILSNIATALMERGDLDGALQSYQESLKGYEALGDMYGSAGILHNLGALYAAREDSESALKQFEKASEIERRIGDIEGLLSSEGARASTMLSMGKLVEARSVLERVLIDGKDSTDIWTMGTCLCLLAEVQLLQGEFETAKSTCGRVLSMPGIEDNARIRVWAQSDLALIHIGAGKFAEAQSIVAGTPPNDLGFELTTRWQLVQSASALARGDVAGAHQIARLVVESAQQKGLKQLSQTAESLMAEPNPKISDLPHLILVGR
jgi:ATP/maltotriose-dependent transcriptional regulator MalT/DNA-binding XRE family transcriptional regulator